MRFIFVLVIAFLLFPALARADQLHDGWLAMQTGDYSSALKILQPLADQGNAAAQSNLSQMYYYGWGVKQNYVEAFKWGRRAAEQGDATAQFNLGYAYERGNGVKQDEVEAYFWKSLAIATRPNKIWLEEIKRSPMPLTPEQIDAINKRVAAWKPTPEQPPAPAAALPAAKP